MNSITKRWVRGNLLITILVMLLAESLFLYFVITSYYTSARTALTSRLSTILTQLSASDAQTEAARGVTLRRMLEQFAEKDKFELMLVDEHGNVAASSAGYAKTADAMSQDIVEALALGERASTTYRTSMDEKVMAVTVPLAVPTDSIVAVRIVTSLTLLDRTLWNAAAFSCMVVFAIISFSVLSGVYFINSIVRPIGEIEHTAAKIAEGNLDIRIENKYNDEIGRLSDTINYMAGQLDKTERMKNDFISSVSHELRTPLTSIKGWTETIATLNNTEDPNYRRGVQVIESETDRLYAMVEELLDFSRLQSGLVLNTQLIDLVAELSDTALMMQARIQQEGLHLRYEEQELPVPVMADPARLRQVFINILDNAVKYSPHGGTITVELLTTDTDAFVNVSDEGRGIAPEDLENVKVKFFKGKGAVRGSGIGLAVVDEIVQAHHGGVDIQSDLGKGTTVTVRLPLYKKENEPAATAAQKGI